MFSCGAIALWPLTCDHSAVAGYPESHWLFVRMNTSLKPR